MQYVFLGAELGARSDDAGCYERGRVVYSRLACTEAFGRGIERIRDGLARGFRPALVCAEKEPLECHRTILVARRLVEQGIGVQHIHADGRLESHAEAIARLARELGLEQPHLFRSDAEAIEDAYRLQEERIAYTAAAPEGSPR